MRAKTQNPGSSQSAKTSKESDYDTDDDAMWGSTESIYLASQSAGEKITKQVKDATKVLRNQTVQLDEIEKNLMKNNDKVTSELQSLRDYHVSMERNQLRRLSILEQNNNLLRLICEKSGFFDRSEQEVSIEVGTTKSDCSARYKSVRNLDAPSSRKNVTFSNDSKTSCTNSSTQTNDPSENESSGSGSDDDDGEDDLPSSQQKNKKKNLNISHASRASETNLSASASEQKLNFAASNHAIALIPKFNEDADRLSQFCKTVRRAVEKIDNSDEAILDALAIKLTGKAEMYAMNLCTYSSVEQLLDDLTARFSNVSKADDLAMDLRTMHQEKLESVEDFGMRVQKLLIRLSNIYASDKSRSQSARKADTKRAHKDALTFFIAGLRNHLGSYVKAESPRDLTEAIRAAQRIDREFKINKKQIDTDSDSEEDATSSTRASKKANGTCKICNSRLHSEARCPDRAPTSCNYCGKAGHAINSCYKLQSDKAPARDSEKGRGLQSRQNFFCTYCEREGHTISRCKTVLRHKDERVRSQQASYEERGESDREGHGNVDRENSNFQPARGGYSNYHGKRSNANSQDRRALNNSRDHSPNSAQRNASLQQPPREKAKSLNLN